MSYTAKNNTRFHGCQSTFIDQILIDEGFDSRTVSPGLAGPAVASLFGDIACHASVDKTVFEFQGETHRKPPVFLSVNEHDRHGNLRARSGRDCKSRWPPRYRIRIHRTIIGPNSLPKTGLTQRYRLNNASWVSAYEASRNSSCTMEGCRAAANDGPGRPGGNGRTEAPARSPISLPTRYLRQTAPAFMHCLELELPWSRALWITVVNPH